jgi:hypothetical protein
MNNLNKNFVTVGDKVLYQRGSNPNLKGMNTQFGKNFGISNKIINTNRDIYKKYDVIPDNGLKSNIINKPHNLIISFDQSHISSPIILNEAFRDVVSIKLLNGILIETSPADEVDSPLFITLSINELNNIYSTSTPAGTSLLNSFATLEYDKTFDRDKTPDDNYVNIYKNKFGINQNIRYFDPPLNSLSQLNISLFDNNTNTATTPFDCKLEFIVETKEKLRVY